MFYYILIFFTVFYHVCLSNCLGIDLFQIYSQVNCPWRSAWIATFRPCKKSCSISGRRRRRPPRQRKTMGRVKSKVGSVPLFCWFFFSPLLLLVPRWFFVGKHFDARFISESMATHESRVFRRSTWKGLVLIQPVPWLNHAWPSTYCGDGLIIWGGVSKIWEPGCFIETFKITVFDCLIVCLPLLPGFEYYTLTLIDKTTITTVLGSRPTLSEACDLMPVCNFRIEFFKHLISVSLISQKFSSLAKDDVMSHQKQAHNRSTTTSWIESVCLSGPLVSIYTQLPCRAETNL